MKSYLKITTEKGI